MWGMPARRSQDRRWRDGPDDTLCDSNFVAVEGVYVTPPGRARVDLSVELGLYEDEDLVGHVD